MSRIPQGRRFAMMRTQVKLYTPPASEANTARWRVNGHGATIIIWTADQWAQLQEHPTDAQYYSCGVWCALRFD